MACINVNLETPSYKNINASAYKIILTCTDIYPSARTFALNICNVNVDFTSDWSLNNDINIIINNYY